MPEKDAEDERIAALRAKLLGGGDAMVRETSKIDGDRPKGMVDASGVTCQRCGSEFVEGTRRINHGEVIDVFACGDCHHVTPKDITIKLERGGFYVGM